MKRITSIVTCSLVAALIAAGLFTTQASAQSETAEVFTVPFAFTADGHSVAAGTYEMYLLMDQHQISIRNLESGEQQFFTVRPEQQPTISSRGLLVFHRCGLRKDLTEFHIPGANLYSVTLPPRHAASSDLERCSENATTTIAAR